MKKLLIATSIIATGIIAISQYMDVEPFDPLEGCESNDELKVITKQVLC